MWLRLRQRERQRLNLSLSAARSSSGQVVVLGLAQTSLAGVLWTIVNAHFDGPVRNLHVPWLVLAAMFVVTEAYVLHIQIRRQAQTVSLSEIPLVLGLLCASPGELLLGRLLGSMIAFTIFRRQAALKTFFNSTLILVDTALAILTFAALLSLASDPYGVGSWIAAYAATAVVHCYSAVAVTTVIAVYEPGLHWRDLVKQASSGVLQSFMTTTIALIAVNNLSRDPREAVLLVLAAGVLVVAYRDYAALSQRHLSLERLFRFTQVVTASPEVDEVLRRVLVEAKDLLHADYAEVTFFAASADAPGARVALSSGDRPRHEQVPSDELPVWIEARLSQSETSVLLPRNSRLDEVVPYLRQRGKRDMILVPLRGEAGIIGALAVADRMGDIRSFKAGDTLLLETVAAQAGVALNHGRLVSQLRHDALHDALTRLPNRVLLKRQVRSTLQEVADGTCDGAVAMIIDLDGFKEVNDTLGHQQGDVLLVEVATRFSQAAGPDALVARLGGEEFAVLMSGGCTEAEAVVAGHRLLSALAEPILLDGVPVDVGASVGVALAPLHGNDSSSLLKRADIAMYAAKVSGRGVTLFESNLDSTDPAKLAHCAPRSPRRSCRSSCSRRRHCWTVGWRASRRWSAGTTNGTAWWRRTSSSRWPSAADSSGR